MCMCVCVCTYFCPLKRLRSSDNLVTMSTHNTQILVSEHYSLILKKKSVFFIKVVNFRAKKEKYMIHGEQVPVLGIPCSAIK